MRRPGEPAQCRRLHYPAADGGRRPRQGGSGSVACLGGRRCHRSRQQRSGSVRNPGGGAQERHHRRPLSEPSERGSLASVPNRSRRGNA
ncbi:hypothetical protein OG976_12680 [Mycobacterium sp. NBC_00419]